MKSLPVNRARLVDVFESVVVSGQPVRLASHNANAIVVSEDAWRAIEQTLYRLSAPGCLKQEGGVHVRG